MPEVTGIPEYTVLAVASVIAVVAIERFWWRTGIFRTARYWICMGIVGFFQILVDGWLTKLSAPIVLYSPRHFLGVRFPWDIPVEDFLFGFSMVTLAILLWVRAGHRDDAGREDDARDVGCDDDIGGAGGPEAAAAHPATESAPRTETR